MTKAIFLDVDGTLVSFQTHRVSPAALEALWALRNQGIKLFIATGRHIQMLSQLQRLFPFDGYITLSGQYCVCGDRVLLRHPIAPQAAAELIAATQSAGFSCIYLEEQEIYINRADQYARQFVQELDLPMPPVRDPSRALDRTLYQAVAFLSRENEHLLLSQAPHLKTTRWHPHFLDVIPASGGKDQGMDAILDYLHIPLEATMAFGDGENDLSMLTHAGIGVAMGSASDQVKAAADYVTGTVDEDGIPSALKHFGLI